MSCCATLKLGSSQTAPSRSPTSRRENTGFWPKPLRRRRFRARRSRSRGTAEVTVKGKKITIDYGRPSIGGHDPFTWAKVGQVWRLGNNMSTSIVTAGDLAVGGTTVKAGKYSLWAKKTGDDAWTLNFHPKSGVWGQPELTEGYIA